MAWKSREDKLPPPSYFSMVVAYLQRAYPGAHISHEMMMTLRPFFIDAWRNGRTAEGAAQTTCSCNGRQVIPSPVTAVHLAKGIVRPPKGAQRGEVFGADELRPPPRIERLQRQLQRLARDEQKQQAEQARWEQRGHRARHEASRAGAERKQQGAEAKRATLMQQAQRIEQELQRVRSELGRVNAGRNAASVQPLPHIQAQETVSAPQVPSLPPAGPKPPPTPAPAPSAAGTVDAKPRRRGRKPRGTAPPEVASPMPGAPAPSGSTQAQSADLLNAVQGLLPNLATQIAAQIAREGGLS